MEASPVRDCVVRRKALKPTGDALARDQGNGPAIDGVRTDFDGSTARRPRFEPGQLPPKGQFALDASARLTGINR